MSKRTKQTDTLQSGHERDQRINQLKALAREGHEDAIGDLCREFNFDFHRKETAHE